jgi:hypothetical protein
MNSFKKPAEDMGDKYNHWVHSSVQIKLTDNSWPIPL